MAEANAQTLAPVQQAQAARNLRLNKRPSKNETSVNPEEIKLIGSRVAKAVGRELYKKTIEKRRETPKPLPPEAGRIDTDSDASEYQSATQAAVQNEGTLRRLRMKAREAIDKYDVMMFLFALILALCKDSTDFVFFETLCWLDWIADSAVGVLLFIFLWGRGGTKWKTRIIFRLLIALGLESFPITGWFPLWSISVIWAWIKASAEKEEALIAFSVIDSALEDLYKIAKKASPKGGGAK